MAKKLFSFMILSILGLFLSVKSYSQTEYSLEKIRLGGDIWLGANVQFVPTDSVSKNAFFVQALGRHTTIDITEKDFFYHKTLSLTYERKLTQKWFGGLSYRYSELNINKNTFRGHLRHFSPIKKLGLTFWQQIAFERILSNNEFYDPVSRLRFQFALNKYFSIFSNPNKKLIGTVSFEIFKDVQKINPNSERRFFQERKIQTEWFFPIYKNVHLVTFAAFRTEQFIALAQFDMEGEEIKPTRRLNQQLPIFGASLLISLGKKDIPNRRLWIE